jgi:amidase
MNELLRHPASGMARAIREKKVSSAELIEAHLERIEAVNSKLNAIVQLPSDRVMAEARAADVALARGEIKGPLHGVPVTFKDAIETAGIISTGGTLGRRNFIPQQDAVIVKRLRAAGAIVLGKTNCPEFGWAWESDNLIYGRTNNPYDLSLSPGGSSGGESALISAGGSPLGFGSDAGGSVRFPANCCGLASIKPTSSRIPRTGHFPGPGGTLDALWQIGPLARSVEDLELALKIVSGVDGHDPAIVPAPLGETARVDVKKLRVAFHTDNGIATPEPEVADAVRKAALALSDAGANVEEALPPGISETFEIYRGLFCADGGAGLRALIELAGTREIHPLLQQALNIQQQHGISMADYGRLVGRWDAFRSAMLGFMENYDALLSPVCSFAGMVHGSTYKRLPSFSYTMTHNLTGWPAAVVLAANTPEGLPIGVQIAAQPWHEHVALAIARVLEESLGGWQAPTV